MPTGAGLGGVHLVDVARHVGLDFRHGAFRFKMSADPVAMMGGGVCWLDFDGDGWLDLYAVNSYSVEVDVARWKEQGGLPRSALYRNVEGRFVDVSRGSGADLDVRGNGCVAADFDGDGRTDLYVTAAGYDALLWNEGAGKFVEGARAAGIDAYGWHAAAAVGDVNADGRPDLFVAGYADLNAPIEGASGRLPLDLRGRPRPALPQPGPGPRTAARASATSRPTPASRRMQVEHGLGAAFTDVDGDGRIDLYVANDLDPNRLYVNVPAASALGFRFEEQGGEAGVADENAGMGVAAADASGDGRADLFVTNSHRQLHGVFESDGAGISFADARPRFSQAFDTTLAGWGGVLGRPRQRRHARPRARQRRHPGHRPDHGRRAGAGARRAGRGRSSTSAPASAWGRARWRTDAASRRPTTTTTATSTWRSPPSAARSCSCGTRARQATGSRSSSTASPPARG